MESSSSYSIRQSLKPDLGNLKNITEDELQQCNTIIDGCFTLFTPSAVANTNGKVLLIFYVITSIFLIVSNAAMLIGLWKTNRRLTIAQRLFFLLSSLDLCLGIVFLPLQVYMILITESQKCSFIMIQAFISMFFPYIVALILLLIIWHRFCIVVNTSFCKKLSSRRVIWMSVGFFVFFSISISIWYVFQKMSHNNTYHGMFYLTSGVITFCYLLTVNGINFKLITFINRAAATTAVKSSTRRNTYHKHVAKTLIMMSVVITLCYTPMAVSFMLSGVILIRNPCGLRIVQIAIPWSQMVMSLNSGINSLIYIIRTKSVSKYFRQTIVGTLTRSKKSVRMNKKAAKEELRRDLTSGTF